VSWIEYTLLAFSSLFVIVDPIAVIPSFLAMTARDNLQTKLRMARLACAVGAGVLCVFSLSGGWIFKILGITLPAFQLAGSILLMRIALDMLYAQRPASKETSEEIEAGTAQDDIAITPLAVPMLAGPGSISTALILMNQAKDWEQKASLIFCILLVFYLSYLVFHFAAKGAHRLSPLAIKLVTRLMGLLLAAVAVQFAFNAIVDSPIVARLAPLS